MRPTVSLILFAMLLCQTSGYPPRYAHRRGQLHRHHKHHEHSDKLPKTDQVLTVPVGTQNATRSSFDKKQAIVGHPEGFVRLLER